MGKFYKLFRDPLYGDIKLTEDELEIVDSWYFQRLRFVSQQGGVYFVYPGARHTRFEHSLGTLKLVNVYLNSIFSNSEDSDLNEYLGKLRDNLEEIFERVGIIEKDGRSYNFQKISEYKKGLFEEVFRKKNNNKLKEYIIHSMEKCMLVHDIGHLAYSHTFERSLIGTMLRAYISESFGSVHAKLHEYIGYQIILLLARENLLESDEVIFFFLIHPEILKSLSGGKRAWRNETGFGHLLKKEINNTPVSSFFELVQKNSEVKKIIKDEKGLFGVLHFLVDSSIDCDRFDYLLRDSHSSGQSAIPFHDITRLMNLATLEKEKEKFRVSFDRKALSMFQNYIHSLYQERVWEIYHHKSVAFDELIAMMIDAFMFENLKRFISYGRKNKSNYLIKIKAKNLLEVLTQVVIMRNFFNEIGLADRTSISKDRDDSETKEVREKLKQEILGIKDENKICYINLDSLLGLSEGEILNIKNPTFPYKDFLLRQKGALSASIFKSFVEYENWENDLIDKIIRDAGVPWERRYKLREYLQSKIQDIFGELDTQKVLEKMLAKNKNPNNDRSGSGLYRDFNSIIDKTFGDSNIKNPNIKDAFFYIIKTFESVERLDEDIFIKNDVFTEKNEEGNKNVPAKEEKSKTGYCHYEIEKLSKRYKFVQPFISFYFNSGKRLNIDSKFKEALKKAFNSFTDGPFKNELINSLKVRILD